MKLISFILFIQIACFSQSKNSKVDVYDLPIPKNLISCFTVLDKTLSDNEINIVKTTQEDSIYFNPEFKDRADFFHAWKIYDGSVLTKYFNEKGLRGSFEIYKTILVSYHRYLNQMEIDLDKLILKYQNKQDADRQIYLGKLEKDSINGIYIPINLKDCFVQLDKILSAEDITFIKNLNVKTETIQLHHTLGIWIRNNWGLWGGSRLQKYLLNRKLTQPDEMSTLILEFYYDWLNNKNDEWSQWAK